MPAAKLLDKGLNIRHAICIRTSRQSLHPSKSVNFSLGFSLEFGV